MRYSSLMLPLMAALGLAACAQVTTTQHTVTTQTVPTNSAGYLTARQSTGLIILPGDTTTPVQLHALEAAGSPTRDNWQVTASVGSDAETTPLLASNLSH
jgi:hypothetical protein